MALFNPEWADCEFRDSPPPPLRNVFSSLSPVGYSFVVVENPGSPTGIRHVPANCPCQMLEHSPAFSCLHLYQLDYAQEVSVASPPESESHLGTPKILR